MGEKKMSRLNILRKHEKTEPDEDRAQRELRHQKPKGTIGRKNLCTRDLWTSKSRKKNKALEESFKKEGTRAEGGGQSPFARPCEP